MGPISSSLEGGTLARLLADSAGVRKQLDQATAQVSSGHVGETYGTLGTAARTPLDLRPQKAHLAAWQSNIDAATGRMDVAQSALKRLTDIAKDFKGQTASLNTLDSGNVDSVAAKARDALREVAGLFDSQYGGVYVFAGADSANPPIPSPDSILGSGLVTGIGTAVAGLSGSGAAAVASATTALAASNAAGTTPFSATLPATASTVEVGEGQYLPTGLVANRNTLAASPPESPTGSWARDLLRGLATLASLKGTQSGDSAFMPLVQDTFKGLGAAIAGLSVEQGALGDVQTRLGAERTRMGETADALTKQISGTEDVDMADAISRLSAVQSRLQASYQLISSQKELSLARFL